MALGVLPLAFLVVALALGLPCSCALPGPSYGLLGVLLVLWVCCPGVALLAASTTLVWVVGLLPARDLVALGGPLLAFLVAALAPGPAVLLRLAWAVLWSSGVCA